MIIRKANINDLKQIMLMYESCVSGMIENNIFQWDSSYPNQEVIMCDINSKTYYVATINNKIVGGVNLDKKQDVEYQSINWNDKRNTFLVVHRLAVCKHYWGKKIGKKLMIYCEEVVMKKNLKSIRLDTYSENPLAINFYKRLGYNFLGMIDLKPGKSKYYCFEKIIP